ncbi:MAG TPA: hypothetical protein VIL28_06700, partial [Steroidobacteraceae bacterium]
MRRLVNVRARCLRGFRRDRSLHGSDVPTNALKASAVPALASSAARPAAERLAAARCVEQRTA